MTPEDPKKQLKTVLAIELAIFSSIALFAYTFWNSICDTTLKQCLLETNYIAPGYFLLLSIVRPFVFTPSIIFSLIAGETFGLWWGAILAAIGNLLSGAAVFFLGKYIGKHLVHPWLKANLPQTLKFIRSQDWKVVLALRLIPIVPFDLSSLVFALLDFRFKSVMLYTFLGTLPSVFMLAYIGAPSSSALSSTLVVLSVASVFMLAPGFFLEIKSRKKGNGMWIRLKAMWNEIMYEIKVNNDVVKQNHISGTKIPVLLIYGFFSSRRALIPLEKHLKANGYEVLSFNLGGLLGVFFTRGITDTAEFVDYKLKRQFNKHNFDQVQIIAHSKGGLVALWWLLKLGGHKYCKRVVTMGTPFDGSMLTWLALITPLGFVWPDVWQMRPKSAFLNNLRQASIPDGVNVYCLYSQEDRVTKSIGGIFQPVSQIDKDKITSISMNAGHFEYLYKRNVFCVLDELLDNIVIKQTIEPECSQELEQKPQIEPETQQQIAQTA